MTHLPPNVYARTPGTRQTSYTIVQGLKPDPEPREVSPDDPIFVSEDKADLPPLIAYYGGASATVWLESRYKIWRGKNSTPRAPRIQGFLSAGNFMFCWGNPLTLDNKEAMKATAEELVQDARQKHKRVVWCCIDTTFAEVLADGINDGRKVVRWSTLSCIQEDVLHPSEAKLENKDVKHNVRRAQKEAVHIEELRLWEPDYAVDERIKKEVEEGLDAWEKSRKHKKGGNIASASLLPWLDASSRRYYLARTPKEIVGILILTPIAHNSYQIKNAISFPSAPRGTSELLLTHVIKEMEAEGKDALTFGASATEDLHLERNIGGWRIKLLAKGYNTVTKRTGLTKRGDFRAKFDVKADALHVSFPPGGFGWGGLVALMGLLRA